MDIIEQIKSFIEGLIGFDIPENYWTIGGTVFVVFTVLFSEWLSISAINFIIRVFRIGGEHGPVGKELAQKMLSAVGAGGIEVDESTLDTDFRLSSGEIDYQPDTGVLQLTEDKATGNSFSSAGMVVLEVGRTLQYRSGSPLVTVRKVLSPVINFCGFAWIYPGIAANVIPLWVGEGLGAMLSSVLYTVFAVMLGLIGLFFLLKIPLEIEAMWRGVSAMKSAEIFTWSETMVIRIFLMMVLSVSMLASLLIALNIFKQTVRG